MPSADEIFLLLPRSAQAPGRARALLRERVAEWGVDEDPGATAELLLSELVTNAVRHARAPQGRDIGIRIARYDGMLRVEVADAGPAVKLTPQVVAEWDERGRGLAIVAALAERWGAAPGGTGSARPSGPRCRSGGRERLHHGWLPQRLVLAAEGFGDAARHQVGECGLAVPGRLVDVRPADVGHV